MANKEAMLDKIARNMGQRGITAVRTATSVTVAKTGGGTLTVTYTDKAVQSPMGGVSPTASPYLGIGIAAPGSLALRGDVGTSEDTLAAILDTVEGAHLLGELTSYGNDVTINKGSDAAVLVRVRGSTDTIGVGS